MLKLSKRLVELRGGLSQAELAKRAGVPQSAISEIETGKRKPRIDTIQKLAMALGVSVSELLGENEDTKAV